MTKPQGKPVREEEDVVSAPSSHGGVDESHPAFGVAIVGRSSGSGRALFQSDMLHNQTIQLSIHTATRGRDLNRDWVHPVQELVEVEMSLAQWGALVSSPGIGSGVPVTIRRTESQVFVPTLPYQPRIQANLDEVNETVGKMVERMRSTLVVLQDAIDSKKGVRAVREALLDHERSLEHAEGNTEYAVKAMADAAEKVTSQARADIESQILAAARLTGMEASIQAPALMSPVNAALALDGAADPTPWANAHGSRLSEEDYEDRLVDLQHNEGLERFHFEPRPEHEWRAE